MRWVALALVVPLLAGCAEEASGEPEFISSSQAKHAADDWVAQHRPDAILLSMAAYMLRPDLDAEERAWYTERGLDPNAAGGSLLDGTAASWMVHYALGDGKQGQLPGHLTLQVTSEGVRTHVDPGRTLAGPAEGAWHHGEDDICFTTTEQSASSADLALLGDAADASSITSVVRQDPALTGFLGDADTVYLRLTGARSSYGNLATGYWCYEPENTWQFTARSDDGSYQARFQTDGAPMTVLDWTGGAGLRREALVWSHTDTELPGTAKSHDIPVEVPASTSWMSVHPSITAPRLAGGLHLALIAPDGTVVYEAEGPGFGFMQEEYPVAGEWTLRYSYTSGLPGTHEADGSVSLYTAR